MGKFNKCSILGLLHNCSGILYNANKTFPATKIHIINTKIFIVGRTQLFAIRYQNKKPISIKHQKYMIFFFRTKQY